MGRLKGEQYPGLITMGAITDDFDAAVLDEKGDWHSIRPKLEAKDRDDYRSIAARAETGMRLIRREAIALNRPASAICTTLTSASSRCTAKRMDGIRPTSRWRN